MKSRNRLISAIGLLLVIFTNNGSAQTKVTITASHARAATDASVIHQAKCEDGIYGIQISRNAGRVSLLLDGVSNPGIDLTKTDFGATFLRKPLYGKFGFSCWNPGAINVFFFGIEIQKGAPPRPVSYRATLKKDGTFVADYGLQAESVDYVNLYLLDIGAEP